MRANLLEYYGLDKPLLAQYWDYLSGLALGDLGWSIYYNAPVGSVILGRLKWTLFLGDPTVKSWGSILHYAFQYPTIFISDIWVRWAAPPGLCITLVSLGLTFVGFSLETWTNPRLNGKGG